MGRGGTVASKFIAQLFTVRRFVLLLLSILVGLFVAFLSSGYWLPWLAPPLANWAGIHIESAERAGPGRIELNKLTYTNGDTQLNVDQVGLPTPLAYLRERWSGDAFTAVSQLRLSGVQVLLPPSPETPKNDSDPSVSVALNRLQKQLASARPWLPGLRLDRLVLQGAGLPEDLIVNNVRFEDGTFTAAVMQTGAWPAVSVKGSLRPQPPWTVKAEAPAIGGRATFRLEPAATGGWTLSGRIRHVDDPLIVRARWGAVGAVPTAAKVSATDFTIPANWLRAVAPELNYGPLTLQTLELGWQDGRYSGELALSGDATKGDSAPVPVRVDCSVVGDLRELRIERAHIDTPWLRGRLDRPLVYRFDTASLERAARFGVKLDLAKQPFVEASGTVDGSLDLRPSATSGLDASFDLSATDLAYKARNLKRATIAGEYTQGILHLREAKLYPTTQQDDALEVRGSIDPDARKIDLSASLNASDGDWLNRLVGRRLFDGAQTIGATIRGSMARPRLTANFDLAATMEGLNRVRLQGKATAQMQTAPFALPTFTLRASAQTQRGGLDAAFSGHWSRRSIGLTIPKLRFRETDRQPLELADEVHLRLDLENPQAPFEQRLHLSPFQLTGGNTEVSGSWETGKPLQLRVANLSSKRIAPWSASELPEVHLPAAELELRALRPSLDGRLSLVVDYVDPSAGRLQLSGASRFHNRSLVAEDLRLSLNEVPLFSGHGSAPVRFTPLAASEAAAFRVESGGDLAGTLSGRSTPPFTEWLKRVTGVVIDDAQFELDLAGTPAAPRGNLSFTADVLEFPAPPTGTNFPALRQVRATLKADANRVELESLRLSVNESTVQGSATVPADSLPALLEQPLEISLRHLANRAQAELSLKDWNMADWAAWAPALLRRSGRLDGNLRLDPGFDFSGHLDFANFGLRPTAALPPIDAIGGRLRLDHRTLTLDEVSAQVGGNPLAFSGQIDLTEPAAPVWNLHATGKNLPLLRTTDMILRSDVDLRAEQSEGASPPVVSGLLGLRSSTLLIEMNPLDVSVRSGPRQSPPYFSITKEPFADWRFALKIRGDDFLRVRSPYFQGRLSADFDLGGSFAQPKLTGAVRTNQAEIRFPGAKMKIDTGEAYITEAQSDAVQLDLTGVAKTASFIVGMEVANTLADPQVQLNATPELSNAEIVRLLATGSVRGGGTGTVGLYLGRGLIGGPGMENGFMDRITLDIGENVTREGKETIDMQYQLGEDFYLHGEYDEYDAYNLDLVWSLFRR